jgi:Lar family restriction alleviation protein
MDFETPKDAKGREIKVGDEVWSLTGTFEKSKTVEDFVRHDSGYVSVVVAGLMYSPLELSTTDPDLEPGPCPFCGNNDVAVDTGMAPRWAVGYTFSSKVVCRGCHCEGPVAMAKSGKENMRKAERKCVKEWNRRA